MDLQLLMMLLLLRLHSKDGAAQRTARQFVRKKLLKLFSSSDNLSF